MRMRARTKCIIVAQLQFFSLRFVCFFFSLATSCVFFPFIFFRCYCRLCVLSFCLYSQYFCLKMLHYFTFSLHFSRALSLSLVLFFPSCLFIFLNSFCLLCSVCVLAVAPQYFEMVNCALCVHVRVWLQQKNRFLNQIFLQLVYCVYGWRDEREMMMMKRQKW